MTKASPVPGKTLLSPTNHTLMMIDFQSQMAFATQSIDVVNLRNNAGLAASAAKEFNVPTILTTIAEKTFSGPIFNEIKDVFPKDDVVDRSIINCWEDSRITDKVNAFGKNKIVMSGLWTSVCVADPALSAADQGFDVYFIADACGDVSDEAHERACERMIMAGCHPMTSLQYLLELQRDWARHETYDETVANSIKFSGAYGLGLLYAKAVFNDHKESR